MRLWRTRALSSCPSPLHGFSCEGGLAKPGSEHLVPAIELLVDQCTAMGQ